MQRNTTHSRLTRTNAAWFYIIGELLNNRVRESACVSVVSLILNTSIYNQWKYVHNYKVQPITTVTIRPRT